MSFNPEYQSGVDTTIRPQSSSTNPYAQNYVPMSVPTGWVNPHQVSQFNWDNNPVSAPAPTSGGGGGSSQPNWDPYWGANTDAHNADIQRQQDELRGQIEGGWNDYLGSLNGILNDGLGSQRTAQENIANSQYTQGENALNTQKAKSMRDISSNIKNAFQAGNIYLGARGAGDSSAANQYGFAVNQEGAKQTGNLNEFVTGKLSDLGSQRDQQINQIAAWFADAQNQIRQQIASGQLSKSRDLQSLTQNLLNQALQAKAQVDQNIQNQHNALLQWATSNSQNIGQLTQNISRMPQSIGAPQIDSTGNTRIPVGAGAFGGSNSTDSNTLFR